MTYKQEIFWFSLAILAGVALAWYNSSQAKNNQDNFTS